MKLTPISPGIKRELILLSFLLSSMFLIGAMFDEIIVFLFIALLVYLIWNLYNLNRLSNWLASPKKNTPETLGAWDGIFYQLYQLYKRQRNARRKLSTILGRFQKSTQALPYATVVLNELNEIEWFNPAAGQMFNLHSNIDIGQRLDNLIRQPKFSRYLKKRNFDEPIEFTVKQSKVLLNITPYASGQYLVSARDITSRSKLDDMRRDFISNASHELRTPLTVMNGYVEFLSHKASEENSEPLDKIQQQLIRMDKIISELIELARLESSEVVDFTTTVDTHALILDVYDEALSLDNNAHNMELVFDLEPDDDFSSIQLSGSYDELRMAVSNLMTNAIRYTQSGGSIKLTVRKTSAGISIFVEDSGPGIDYEHITRLTERFYRVDEGRSREKGGTGLGLAIVKHVLDRHQANLHIQSEIGKGTSFRCDFPILYTQEQID